MTATTQTHPPGDANNREVAAQLARLMEAQQEVILDAWVEQVAATWQGQQPQPVDQAALRQQSRELLAQLLVTLRGGVARDWLPAPDSELARLLTEISETWAKQGLAAAQTALYVLTLKRVVIGCYQTAATGDLDTFAHGVEILDSLLDRLSLLAVERLEAARERLIKQQSLSLLELSTPVVKIWDRMILLPLVGVIDTARARQITETLLDAIAAAEAQVTIVDITGVPVLDTAVAGHLMKTINAAQMLGTHVVLTGMSPEGAQTLVKLGVTLGDVTTRASLRAGVTEGLAVMGKAIVDGRGRR